MMTKIILYASLLLVLFKKSSSIDHWHYSEARSSFNRAKSNECKAKIVNESSRLNRLNSEHFFYLTSEKLQPKCPQLIKANRILYKVNEDYFKDFISINLTYYMPDLYACKKECFEHHFNKCAFKQSYKHNESYCICFTSYDKKSTHQVQSNEIIQTIYDVYKAENTDVKTSSFEFDHLNRSKSDLVLEYQKLKHQTPRFVFVFVINQRIFRHIVRLFKTIYDDYHYYYFHVDQKSKYLRYKMEQFMNDLGRHRAKAKSANKEVHLNVKLSEWSGDILWGGASRFEVYLRIMNDLVRLRQDQIWHWDYFINLSETDFILKPIEALFLNARRFNSSNIIGSFPDNPKWHLPIDRSIYWHFVACDNYTWLIGPRKVPPGLKYYRGQDWFLFHRDFVEYLVHSNDSYLSYLKSYFKDNSIASGEHFFITALKNSPFCTKVLDLKFRYFHFRNGDIEFHHMKRFDWWGASPDGFTFDQDLELYQNVLKESSYFFARKFDPLLNSKILNFIDQDLNGAASSNADHLKTLNSYWLNVYDRNVDNAIEWRLEHLISSLIDHKFNEIKTIRKPIKLNNVHQYFRSDRFEGLLLDIDLTTTNENRTFNFELFYLNKFNRALKPKYQIEQFTNEEFRRAFYSRDLVSAKVYCNDEYDSYGASVNNHQELYDINCKLILKLKIKSEIKSNFSISIKWINWRGEVKKSSEIKMFKSFGYLLRIVQDEFDLNELSDLQDRFGKWQVKVKAIYAAEAAEDELKMSDRVTFIKDILVIMPNRSGSLDAKYRQEVVKYWPLRSICLNSGQLHQQQMINEIIYEGSLTSKRSAFKSCKLDSNWSSFHPDPKSDVFFK